VNLTLVASILTVLPFSRDWYEPWALMRSDRSSAVAGKLLALTTLEINLCLKVPRWGECGWVACQFYPYQPASQSPHFDRELVDVVDYARYLRRVHFDTVPGVVAEDLIPMDEAANKQDNVLTPEQETSRAKELERELHRASAQQTYLEVRYKSDAQACGDSLLGNVAAGAYS
jgi:hypothetical protein